MTGRRLFLILFLSASIAILSSAAAAAQDRGLTVIAREVTGRVDFEIGKQYAVIIGIDRYTEWPGLRSAVAEAKSVRKVLGERYYIDEFFELYDEDATAANIRRLFLDTLAKKVGAKDSLLVFYAGHGQLDATNTGFWIASDGSKDVYAQNNWIPNAQARNMIGGLKAQRILILADSCFSGDFLNVSRSAAPVVDSAYYRKALQLTARQVLTSGASESVPDESEFGRQLLNLLERNDEPLLDPVSIYERIRLGVQTTLPLLGTLPGNEEGASFVLFLRQGGAGASSAGSGAAASVAAAGTADIMVRAEEGAVVFVNGLSYGKAPVLVKKLESGRPLTVSARTETKAGSLEVNLKPGELREVSLALAALTGNLYVNAAESAVNLWIDGVDKGPLGSGLFQAIPVGIRRIELRGADLYGEARTTIASGETAEAKVIVRPVGRLEIDAPEGVPIAITGEGWTIERRGGGIVPDVPAGMLRVSAGGQGFLTATTRLSLGRGKSASWRPYAGGTLQFAVSPVSVLCFIDGAPGVEAKGSLDGVAPGTRNLVLRKPGYRDRSLSVTVTLGKNVRVQVSLVKLAPATVRMPVFGIGFGIDKRVTDASYSGTSGDTAQYSVSAGLPLTLYFASPYIERIDVPDLSGVIFAEGERRDLTIPAGRFSLPWIPAGAAVKVGSGQTVALHNEGSQGYLSPILPAGQYRVSLVGEDITALVTIRPDGISEPEGYRAALLASLNAERGGYAKQLAAKRGITTAGFLSLAAGIVGAAGAGTVYYLGSQAMEAYRTAPDTVSAAARWKDVQLWQVLFDASAAVGGVGLGLSPIFFLGGPDPNALQRSIDALDEGIKALGN
jgi:hypothetical protein